MSLSNKLVAILGPTAVGKTKFASQLAYKFNGEIISADSRQVYIGMDIGTGKDLQDYFVQNHQINTHLINVVKPHCEFNLYLFTQLFKRSYKDIQKVNHLPFLVGGTGLYLSSVLQSYSLQAVDFNSKRALELRELSEEELRNMLSTKNKNLHNTTDLLDKERILKAILIEEKSEVIDEENFSLNALVIGLHEERDILKDRIQKRLKDRLKTGMIEEAEKLLENGITHEKLRFFGLEYKYLSLYLAGEINYNDMYQKLVSSIYKFSKRQMTWFRKMEKEGIDIHWLKNKDLDQAESLINNFIN